MADDQQGFSQDGGSRLKQIINSLSGGGTPGIQKSLDEEHERKKAELEMYQSNAKTLAGILMKGVDPATGKPLTDEQKRKYQQQYDAAWGAYTKGIKGNKAASAIAQKLGGIVHHLTGRSQPSGGAPQGGAPAAPAGGGQAPAVPPPPAGGQPRAAAPAGAAPSIPPPPNMMEQQGIPALAEQAAGREKAEQAGMAERAKAEADAGVAIDPRFRTNDLKIAYDQVNEAFPDLPEDEKQRLAELKAGFIPKSGAGGSSIKGWATDEQGNQIPMTIVGGEEVPLPVRPGFTPFNPTMQPTQRTSEQPGIDVNTGKPAMLTTHSTSQKVIPRKGGKASVPAPPKGGGGGGGSASRGGGGQNIIPMRQYNALMKPATAVDEARASLIGDDPNEVGGLAADLSLFDNPQSVKRVSEYLALVNGQIEAEGKAVAGAGPMAALEWYANLPQTVTSLQQGALRAQSEGLLANEQQFVADYYRVLGTIGGMRAATGASAARWSYNTLRAELPTPGPVTNRTEATRRLRNFVNETNVVAKRNPLLKPTDTNRVNVPPPPGKEFWIVSDKTGKRYLRKDPSAPVPKGFHAENAPAASQ